MEDSVQLTCEHCGQRIPAEDINLANQIAKCRACDHVFGFEDQIDQGGDDDGAWDGSLPKGFVVTDLGDRLLIRRRWFSWIAIPMLFFCIVWDGTLVFWYGMATQMKTGSMQWVFLLFPLLHVAVGVGITYFTLAMLLNKTWIEVDPHAFTVRHRPLPWPGNRRIDPAAIEQLYGKREKHQSRDDDGDTRTWYTYELHAQLLGGKHEKLLSGLEKPQHVRYIEQEMEKWLGIKDRRVVGQMRG